MKLESLLLLVLGLGLVLTPLAVDAAPKKKKKTEQSKQKDPPKETPKEAPKEVVVPVEPKTGPTEEELAAQKREEERQRVEAAKKKLELEARKPSKITPGTASRWSNKGAMDPIAAEVPITTQLPDRAIPIAPGAETPGQSLIGQEELLQFRLYFSANHMETRGQDFIFVPVKNVQGQEAMQLPDIDRDIDLYRGRASISYEHIAGSDVGFHLDLEYRGRSSGARRTDHRINELYISYGLTDFRRDDAMNFGVAVGRVAVREAGYAQADGALVRLKLSDELRLGVFGGFTGNPYGYNWAARETQEISTDWLRAGAFGGYRASRLFANVAGVATLNRLAGQPLPGKPGTPVTSGVDRVHLYLDAGFLATETINLFLTGWIDLIGGDLLQNVEAVFAWAPTNDFDLRLSAGRFGTLIYDVSTAYSFEIDPDGNTAVVGVEELVFIDENGNPIVPFDAVLGSVNYTTFQARAGFRPIRSVELFASTELMLRDAGKMAQLTLAASGAQLGFAPLRLLPSAGVRFRDPELLDASVQFTYILDDQSNANALLQGGIGREFFGLFGRIDARRYFGDIPGSDIGIELSYTLPREWMTGRLTLRTMFRYFRESVAILRPENLADGQIFIDETFAIPAQETYLGFASVEWRF